MSDPLLPFSTVLQFAPGMTQAEKEEECRKLFQRQRAIDAFLRDSLPADILFDLLAEDQIDPYQWVEASIANVTQQIGSF